MTAPTESLTEDRSASVLGLAQEQTTTLQVSDLADQAGYSPFHVSRLFSAHMGIGPGTYLIAVHPAPLSSAPRPRRAVQDRTHPALSGRGGWTHHRPPGRPPQEDP